MDRIKIQYKSTNNKDKNVTIMTSMDTERHTVGETAIKMTTETTIRLKESTASILNTITVVKEATGLLIFVERNENRNTMTSTTSSWEPHSVEKFKKRIMKNISNNVLKTAVHHCILHIKINTRQMLKIVRSMTQ